MLVLNELNVRDNITVAIITSDRSNDMSSRYKHNRRNLMKQPFDIDEGRTFVDMIVYCTVEYQSSKFLLPLTLNVKIKDMKHTINCDYVGLNP